MVNLWWTYAEQMVNICWTNGEHMVKICWTYAENMVNIWWNLPVFIISFIISRKGSGWCWIPPWQHLEAYRRWALAEDLKRFRDLLWRSWIIMNHQWTINQFWRYFIICTTSVDTLLTHPIICPPFWRSRFLELGLGIGASQVEDRPSMLQVIASLPKDIGWKLAPN